MSFTAIIPARSGSKSIPNKNITPLAGQPLIAFSIQAALAVESIGKVYVNTNCTHIAGIAKEYGAEIIDRPDELAQDHSLTIDVVKQSIQDKSIAGPIILLQPTSPLRTSEHIEAAIDQFEKADCKSLISVCCENHHPYKSFLCDDSGELSPTHDKASLFKPRQQLPKAFRQNGAIYIFSAEDIVKADHFFLEPCVGFEMDDESSIDIDNPEDLIKAEKLLSSRVKTAKLSQVV